MNIETHSFDSNVLVKLTGRLDSTTSDEFDKAMQSAITGEFTTLSIDLSDVDYISSKGLRVLVSVYKQLNGTEMILLSPNPSVVELLRISGLLNIFTIK